MRRPTRTRIKICCIGSVAEARLAIRHGADAVGLVSAMPSGAGIISDAKIREIAPTIPPGVDSFLLTCQADPERIVQQQRAAGTTALQLVDRLPRAALELLRRRLPGVKLVQVVHVEGPEAIDEALRVEPYVDVILLDSGRPSAPVAELGGTGRTHDWGVSAELVAAVEAPVFLAGGLDPSNVGAAIARVRPFGVDICSRLRPEGVLDEGLLVAFLDAVRAADRSA